MISALAVGRTRTVAEPRWSPDGTRIGWIESFAGRADVLVAPADGEEPPAVVSPDIAVTGVGAYGGGAWCWGSDTEIVYSAVDGRLVAVAAAGGRGPRVLASLGRASAPWAGAGAVWFSVDEGDACHIARVDLDGTTWPARVSSGGDFAWDPCGSGPSVAWVEWDLPSMPFDESRILLASTVGSGEPRVVAGGGAVSVGQPRFSPDGRRLAYVSDATGWWNVWVADADGAHAHPVLEEPHDHARPTWSPGQRSFAWSPDGSSIAICRNEDGFGRLITVPVRGRKARGGQGRARAGKGLAPLSGLGPEGDRRGPDRREDSAGDHRRRSPQRVIDACYARGAGRHRTQRGRARSRDVAQRERDGPRSPVSTVRVGPRLRHGAADARAGARWPK